MRPILIALALLVHLAGPALALPESWSGTEAGHAVPPVTGPVIRPFQPPASAFGPGHRGVDLVADPGQAVIAALEGTVAFAGTVAGLGWVTIDHGGDLSTTYGDVVPAVGRGQHVGAGEILGVLAPAAGHLDWGARVTGDYIDPLLLLGRWSVRLTDPVAAPSGEWTPAPAG